MRLIKLCCDASAHSFAVSLDSMQAEVIEGIAVLLGLVLLSVIAVQLCMLSSSMEDQNWQIQKLNCKKINDYVLGQER